MAETQTITTEQDLKNTVGNIAAGGEGIATRGVLPIVTPTLPTVKEGEILEEKRTLSPDEIILDPKTISTTPTVTTPSPSKGLGQVEGDITRNVPNVGTLEGEQIVDPKGIIKDIPQGTVSEDAIVDPATQELDEKATTQYQLDQLFSSLKEGKPLPAWASAATRKMAASMQARGLGASSMASAAITQALMESGIPIAAQDANKYAAIQLQNLNNEQQAALQNAATFAAMDKANLNARLQGAVTNAQSLLQVDLANLNAKQKSNELTFSALTQALFKDTAQENARNELNAKNEMQVEQYFAQLGSQVETANANRQVAVDRFNAGEINAVNQYNATLRDSRDKFNSSMGFAIDQNNVKWRRDINTAQTALQNEANRVNVQNQYNMTQAALNQMWLMYRDNAAWNFQKSESQLQRQHEIGMQSMNFSNDKTLYNKQVRDDIGFEVGGWLVDWVRRLF